MSYVKPVKEIIEQRFSCRSYLEMPIAEGERRQLADFIAAHQTGPFGSPTRFALIAATEAESEALRGLGTYGFIKRPAGFIVGAMGEAEKNLEDFGYAMERIILFATDLGLGTCWLGGSFTKGRFADQISAKSTERVPAVTSVGYISDESGGFGARIRRRVGDANRKRHPWERMFFRGEFDIPLSRAEAGAYATPLEMMRLGPSASNKQPWRIIQSGNTWHFYLQRSPGYRQQWAIRLLNVDDMQRLDMGIAMCHFELTADELGLSGTWQLDEPRVERPDERTEYIASWVEMLSRP